VKSWRITCLALVLTLGPAALASRRGEVRVTDQRLDSLPRQLGPWSGEDHRFDDKVYKALNADANLLRMYTGGGADLWLYIGYYGTEKGGRTGHLPRHCYPGSGWEIERMGRETVAGPGGDPRHVNTILVRRGEERRLALYWIHAGGDRVLDSGWRMNVTRLFRRIAENRDDGAFVRISGPVGAGGVAEATAA
jgi:EpsI family protein